MASNTLPTSRRNCVDAPQAPRTESYDTRIARHDLERGYDSIYQLLSATQSGSITENYDAGRGNCTSENLRLSSVKPPMHFAPQERNNWQVEPEVKPSEHLPADSRVY
jgi:hypothetical protein